MTAKSKERRYAETGMTAAQIDQLVVRMKAQGYGLKDIAAAVGLTPSGVHRALARLERIDDRRPGRTQRA